MLSIEDEPAVLTQYIRKVRGGSQAILAQASDGRLYVTKLCHPRQGSKLLFNESMGTELYRVAGLSVPPWRPLVVTSEFAHRNPGCWFDTPQGVIRPQAGLCFGSHFLGGEDTRLFEILPGNSFKRVRNRADFWMAWLLDVCANHADNRQAIFRRRSDGYLDAVFIDHGHMFSNGKGNRKRNVIASQYYLDPRIYPKVCSELVKELERRAARLDCDRLWSRLSALPDEWISHSAVCNFTECLETLSNPGSIARMIEVMIGFQRPTCEVGQDEVSHERQPADSLLRPGIQAGGIEWSICA